MCVSRGLIYMYMTPFSFVSFTAFSHACPYKKSVYGAGEQASIRRLFHAKKAGGGIFVAHVSLFSLASPAAILHSSPSRHVRLFYPSLHSQEEEIFVFLLPVSNYSLVLICLCKRFPSPALNCFSSTPLFSHPYLSQQ